jgi:mRNA-degrading endonuclease RelE of RelBE toxin-antitoxin system
MAPTRLLRRYRVGNLRVVYKIEEQKVTVIVVVDRK